MQRYELRCTGLSDPPTEWENDNGDYVLYSDHLAEIAQKDAALKLALETGDNLVAMSKKMEAEIAALRAEPSNAMIQNSVCDFNRTRKAEAERDALREGLKGLYNCRLEPDKLLCMLERYHKGATHEPEST